jgi:hypothetical protein
VRDLCQRGDVGDAEQRVRRGLAPQQRGAPGTDGSADGVEVVERHGRVLDAPPRQHLGEQPARAAVRVVGMTTWLPGAVTVRSRQSSAARPLAKARPVRPPSSAARQVSSAVRVGLPLREYS